MHLEIRHETRYTYDRLVQLRPHLLYLRPRENPMLSVQDFTFAFSPVARVEWMRDDFDNLPARVRFDAPTRVLEIKSACTAVTADAQPFDFHLRDYAARFPFDYEPLHQFNLSPYLNPPAQTVQGELRAWIARHLPDPPRETVAWLFGLNRAIHGALVYRRRDEPGIQSAMTTVTTGSGTCRDYAALLIACARTAGIAARFVSGYMYDPAGEQEGTMHAWVEVFLPGAGWKGLDPTHGLFCDQSHIPVAHAVVAESVNPIQGTYESNEQVAAELITNVRVRRLDPA